MIPGTSVPVSVIIHSKSGKISCTFK